MVAVGISDNRTNETGVNNGQFNSFTDRNVDASFGWLLAWNNTAGDTLRVDIVGSSGKAILSTTQGWEKGDRRHFRFAGKKKSAVWRSGIYIVSTTILRSGGSSIIRQMRRTVNLR
jgi:hypothetical protein